MSVRSQHVATGGVRGCRYKRLDWMEFLGFLEGRPQRFPHIDEATPLELTSFSSEIATSNPFPIVDRLYPVILIVVTASRAELSTAR